MIDTLTPERIAELRPMCEPPWCMEGGVEVLSNDLPVSDLAALLDAAEERAKLRAENVKLRSLLTRVKRVLPPGELYEAILSVLHEEET